MLTLVSCGNDPWGPPEPVNFTDSRLTGYWQLVQVNGMAVTGTEVNFLYFSGNGNGLYYYFQNGRRYYERLQYWCQNSINSMTQYQVNILYESSYNPTTMNYRFYNGNNSLYLTWADRNGLTTYLYTRYPSAPW